MNLLQISALILVLAAAFGTINALYLRLPTAIGILVVALLASFAVMGIDLLIPAYGLADTVRAAVLEIDFSDTLLDWMLGLLLFAGALHVRLEDLRKEWPIILLMATMGVALSTAVAGLGFAALLGMPILIALIFGALISPTDPVAVLGILRAAKLDPSLETRIAGESLFNDGVGYVVFLVLVGIAFPTDDNHATGLAGAGLLFVQEALGGALLGLVLGWLTWQVMRRVDEYSLEVLLTLALAFGGYELAIALHVSAPIMAVCAGLLIGEISHGDTISESTRDYIDAFWKLIDEILNAVLFLLIGLEVFAVAFGLDAVKAGIAGIVLSLLARLAAVAIPITLLRPFRRLGNEAIPIMTWGGLKGGISVALVLSLPDNEWKPLLLTATYMIVLFSILVQGLTVAPLAKRLTAN